MRADVNTAHGAANWKEVIHNLSRKETKQTTAFSLSPAVIRRLNAETQNTGVSKSRIVDTAIRMFFGMEEN